MDNKEKPLVSCVMTSYKRDAAIAGRALDSMLSQTYENTEIIIVDDNRGEGAEAWSEGLEKLRNRSEKISVIKTERGHGAQRARNTGIEHSRGKYVAFLDDDDEWMWEKLEKQVALMESDPDIGLCYTDGYIVRDTVPPEMRPQKSHCFCKTVSYKEMLKEDHIGTTSQVMIRKNVFDTVGYFDETLPARQDYEMWIRITKQFKAAGIPDLLYKYHKIKGGTQVSHNWKNCVRGYAIIHEKYKEDIDKDREALFNIRFQTAHQINDGAHSEKDLKLFISSFIEYMRACFTDPALFMHQAYLKVFHKLEWIRHRNRKTAAGE